MSLVTVTLNGIPVQADTGQTILEVARRSGITIPTLCHDLRLKPFGSCRVCLVKVEGARNFVPSCSTSVTDGMIIDTEDREVVEARRLSLALLISDHYGDCVAPCSLECPAHIDIQGYIALIRAGQYQEAVKLIKERNPMPVTIGRICPHPCEEVCRRSRVDEPIAINNLKRFAADYDIALDHPWVPDREAPKNKKVAVIGAGPAGLSAAWYLTAWGYEVTIYERWPKAGGMLRYGIPEYRLPKDILDREIELVQKLGAEILYDTLFGRDVTLASLRADGYEAVFLGIGAQRSYAHRGRAASRGSKRHRFPGRYGVGEAPRSPRKNRDRGGRRKHSHGCVTHFAAARCRQGCGSVPKDEKRDACPRFRDQRSRRGGY